MRPAWPSPGFGPRAVARVVSWRRSRAFGSAPASAAQPAPKLTARVAHTDARFGTPSFTWISGANLQNLKLSANATPTDVAWATVRVVAEAR